MKNKTIEPIMKRLMLIANDYKNNGSIDAEAKRNFYTAMGELIAKTGCNYEQAEDMIICWIEDPEKVHLLQEVG